MTKNNSCEPVHPKKWLTITLLNSGKLYKITPSVRIPDGQYLWGLTGVQSRMFHHAHWNEGVIPWQALKESGVQGGPGRARGLHLSHL